MPTLEELQNQAPTQPMPTQQPLPAMPMSLQPQQPQGIGQMIGSTLGGMAKSALGTVRDTLPSAIANYALFGDSQMARNMTYAGVMNQLQQKRQDEELKRGNLLGDIATSWWLLREQAGKFGVTEEQIDTAILGGAPTGNQQVDDWVKQFHQGIGPIMKEKNIGAGDLLTIKGNLSEYSKLKEKERGTPIKILDDNNEPALFYPGTGEQVSVKGTFYQAPAKQKYVIGDIRKVTGKGGKQYSEEVISLKPDGTPVWGKRTDVTEQKPYRAMTKEEAIELKKAGKPEINVIPGQKFEIQKENTAIKARAALMADDENKDVFAANAPLFNRQNPNNELAYWEVTPGKLYGTNEAVKIIKLPKGYISAGWTPEMIQEYAVSEGVTVKEAFNIVGRSLRKK